MLQAPQFSEVGTALRRGRGHVTYGAEVSDPSSSTGAATPGSSTYISPHVRQASGSPGWAEEGVRWWLSHCKVHQNHLEGCSTQITGRPLLPGVPNSVAMGWSPRI